MESKNIIRKYFSELCQILISLPDILDSITMKFYAKELISPSTKSVIMSSLSVPQKANLLLTYMEIRVDQYRECFPLICSILKKEAKFGAVTTKMRYDYDTNEDTSDSPALLQQIHDDHNSTACDIDDTADNLEMVFDSLKKQMKRMAINHSEDVNFSWLKEHVQLRFQYACIPSYGKMSPCLIYQEIQDSTTLESLMKVMLETHVFGYLDFEVLYTFMSFFQTEETVHKKFEQYKKNFILFIQNNFKSIIDSASQLLEMKPDLDLPELEVELDKRQWESKSLLQWNETMKSIVEWSENLMIKAIEPHNDKIVIKYYFLPFKLLRIANELENKAIVKKFNSVSAKYSPLLARLLEIRDSQLKQIVSEIELHHVQQDHVDDVEQATALKDMTRFDSSRTSVREANLKKTIQKRLTVLDNAISTLNERKISRTDQIALKAEKKICESLNIQTDIWFPKDMPAKDMVKKLTSYSRKMNKVLKHDTHTLCKPFEMKGMLFTGHENDILTGRFPLLETKTLIAPQHDAELNCTIIKSQLKTFRSKQDEEMFFKHLRTANASMAKEYQTNRIMHTSTKYLSTVKVSTMLSCSYIIDAENDFKISTNAKKKINNLDNVVKKHLAQRRVNRNKVLKECKDFLNRYGSHISIGPIQVGAIYWVKCYTNKQTSLAEKIEAFHKYVVDADKSFIPVLAINGSHTMNIAKFEFRHDAADITSKDLQNTFIEIQSRGKDVPIGNEEWILGHLGNYYDTIILDHGKYVPVWDIIITHYQEKLSCPEELVLALKESHFQLSMFYKFLEHIRFEHYHDKKLTLQVAIKNCIKEKLQNSPKLEDLPLTMLQKIMHYNCSMFELPNNSIAVDNCADYFEGDFEYPFSQQIHPVSIFLSIFLCANHLLRQEMLCRLSTCQLAVPLIFRDPYTKKLIFPLWAIRSIIKKIKTGNQANSTNLQDEKEIEIVEYEMPIISFLRLTNLKKMSKSKIMNDVIDSDNMVRFFHRDSSGGFLKRQIGNGMIDMSWYIPGGRDNIFSNAITFLNLHGNAAHKNNQNQVKFLRECSSMCFVLVEEEITEQDKELITSLSTQSQCHTIVMFLDGLKGNFRVKNVEVVICESTNAVLIKNKFQKVINEKLKNRKCITERKIASFHVSAVNNGIDIDENSNELQTGKEADKVITEIAEVSEASDNFKTELVPLQGKRLWHDWVEKDKEQYRMVNKGSTTITDYNNQLEMGKKQIMDQRKNYKLHSTVRKVASVLHNTTCDENLIFLQNIRLGLNNVSRKNLVDHYKEYFEIRSQYHAKIQKQQHESNTTNQKFIELKKKLGEKYETITKFSFGLEHILREVAHVYEVDASKHTNERQFSFLAKAAAKLLIQAGHALELMDGDSAYVQIKWIKAVLNECKESLGAKSKVYIISVLGVQSAGKSTLLNTMFGVQFNVGAGRCTRGAYMQLLPVHEELKEKLHCDYIIIVDTGGLHAPEMPDSQQHDRELSTFVIGIADLTLIKLNGEIAGEMEDILHTTVHAFIRMHIAELRPSCKFIFQASADRKVSLGEDKFVERLDEITLWAAKGEKHFGNISRFTQVINYNPGCDIHYHGGLWKGNPPMAPVNNEYSESAESLKNIILDRIAEKKDNCLTIAEFSTRLDILWKSLLSEDFVFNFKNAMEINAYKDLERTYSDYEWDLQHKLYQWYETTLNVLDNDISTDSTTCNIELLLDSTKKKLNSIHAETLKDVNEKLVKYFKDSTSAHIIVKWKETFQYKIRKFAESLRDKIEDKCIQHINNKLSRREIKRDLGPVFEQEVILLVDDVANDTKTRQADLSEDELLELFECHAWKKIKGKVKLARTVVNTFDVEKDVETELLRYFKVEKQQFVRMKILDLSGKKCISLLLVIVEGTHIIMKDDEKGSLPNFERFLISFSNPDTSKHKIKNLRRAQNNADMIFQSAHYYLDSIKGQIYKPPYVCEMLKEMEMTRDRIMEKETEFDLTEEYWLEACVIACKYAIENHFNEMIERYNQENDPFYYLENEVKPPLLSQFLSKYYQFATEKKTAKSFCIIIINNIWTQIKRCLGHKIVDKMKSEGEQCWPFDKRALKAKIMIDMAESNDFQNYIMYLKDAKQSFQFWTKRYLQQYCDSHMIQAVLLDEILSMKDFIIIKLNELEQSFASKTATVEAKAFLKAFCKDQDVIDRLGKINDSFWGDAGEIDVKHFSKCLKQELEATETNEKKSFEKITFEQMMKWENRPDQFIQDKLGCCEQCPFCGEICDLAYEHGAEVKHIVQQHRPQCLKGYRKSSSKKVVTEICTLAVCGEGKFRNRKTKREYHPYKEYATIYPNWYIQADASTDSSAYWKWFTANNMSSIAEHYSALPNEIPEPWKELDWSIVKEDLLSSSK